MKINATSVKDRVGELLHPTGEEELMAVAYPKPRVEISVKHALIGASCIGLVIVGLVLSFLFSGSSETPAQEPEIPGLHEVSTSGVVTQEDAAEIVISVIGAVEHSGVFRLPAHSRVIDALEKATPVPGAQTEALNLAQKLQDGQQIRVPHEGEVVPEAAPGAGDSSGQGGSSGVLSLNSATAPDLEALPGVGQKTAEAIIAHRESIGGFTSVDQLLDVKGIGPAKFADISPHVGV